MKAAETRQLSHSCAGEGGEAMHLILWFISLVLVLRRPLKRRK